MDRSLITFQMFHVCKKNPELTIKLIFDTRTEV